ncbi:NADH-quinone oxidoreductase subunit L [Buchnera aphidicola]|uniref:NADH-quinone oxidoreductase subunit L n=1 Tax=Buchnera aphidicola TaxID=9 RepID=UPI0031B85CB2
MNYIHLLILLPFTNFFILSFFGNFISKKKSKCIGFFFSFLIFFLLFCINLQFYYFNNRVFFIKNFFNWVSINRLNIDCSFLIDELSIVMLNIILFIGFLIYFFSLWYMNKEKLKNYYKFFSYINLFIFSMLLLVLSDNLIFLYFGWEMVGVCSYLLIGFYYKNKKNSFFSNKAFFITRIGDIFLLMAIVMLYNFFNTFNFLNINNLINSITIFNEKYFFFITLFLFFSAISKSAQFPLQIWLSGAMVGPTPVSALIHSATMITAGVYLIARMYNVFLLNPLILYFISILGTVTLFIGCIFALNQNNLKKILAYSTISQIGYMFLSLGVQSWDGAIFHLVSHGFFKALLFLSSSILILYSNNIKNIFKIKKSFEIFSFLYFCFIFGCFSLISFPFITSGFYSKGNILFNVLQNGNIYLFIIGLFCTFLTSIYTFKMFFIIFFKNEVIKIKNNLNILISLFILMFFSTFFGFFIIPNFYFIFPLKIFSEDYKFLLEFFSGFFSIFGILFSYYFWVLNKNFMKLLFNNKYLNKFFELFFIFFSFDWLYEKIFVNFYIKLSKFLYFDLFYEIKKYFIFIIKFIGKKILFLINGYLRWYITLMIFGFLLIFSILEKL